MAKAGIKGTGTLPSGRLVVNGVEYSTPRSHSLFSKTPEVRTILGRWENPVLDGIKRLPKLFGGQLAPWRIFGALVFVTNMMVDENGAPDAYGPSGTAHQVPYDPTGIEFDSKTGKEQVQAT